MKKYVNKKTKNLYLAIIITISIICLFLGLFFGKNYLKENDKKKKKTNEPTQNNYYGYLYYTNKWRNQGLITRPLKKYTRLL